MRFCCREAEASCEFAGAFWLAAQCARALEPVTSLHVAHELGQSASVLYAGTIQHLEAALAAVCADFRPDQFAKVPVALSASASISRLCRRSSSQQMCSAGAEKAGAMYAMIVYPPSPGFQSRAEVARPSSVLQVLEGYVYLGALQSLGEEVVSAFTGTISAAVTKTVRGIIVGRPGLEERARTTAIFGELVKLLPADLFRPCLAQVCQVPGVRSHAVSCLGISLRRRLREVEQQGAFGQHLLCAWRLLKVPAYPIWCAGSAQSSAAERWQRAPTAWAHLGLFHTGQPAGVSALIPCGACAGVDGGI